MNFQKLILKIAYWLVAISILVLLGFTFIARRIISEQPQGDAPANQLVIEETTKIDVHGISVTFDDKKAQKEVAELKEAMKKEEAGRAD